MTNIFFVKISHEANFTDQIVGRSRSKRDFIFIFSNKKFYTDKSLFSDLV